MSQDGQHIGLFFGSFNPVHTGHLIIANWFVYEVPFNQVWFIVSPQNPFKNRRSLLNEYDRLHLVELAIGDNPRLRASNIEFNLPQPSYTIDTLTWLQEQYPDKRFSLIMGSDNLLHFPKWKNHEAILKYHHIYVYTRDSQHTTAYEKNDRIHLYDVPLLQISSSLIRQRIKSNRSIQYMVPDAVRTYLLEMNLYS